MKNRGKVKLNLWNFFHNKSNHDQNQKKCLNTLFHKAINWKCSSKHVLCFCCFPFMCPQLTGNPIGVAIVTRGVSASVCWWAQPWLPQLELVHAELWEDRDGERTFNYLTGDTLRLTDDCCLNDVFAAFMLHVTQLFFMPTRLRCHIVDTYNWLWCIFYYCYFHIISLALLLKAWRYSDLCMADVKYD